MVYGDRMALLRHLLAKPRRCLSVLAVAGGDVGSLLGQGPGDGAAYPSGASGDDRHPTSEDVSHIVQSPLAQWSARQRPPECESTRSQAPTYACCSLLAEMETPSPAFRGEGTLFSLSASQRPAEAHQPARLRRWRSLHTRSA